MRIRPGAYVDAEAWRAAEAAERELVRIAAVVGTRAQPPVLSHESAAAVWGLPRIGRPPIAVELVDLAGTKPHSRNGVLWRRSAVAEDEIVEIDGLLVTDLARTLADLARRRPFASAVAALDHGTKERLVLPGGETRPGTTKEDVLVRVLSASSNRGRRLATRAIEFSDARADRPGESLSRARIHALGFPPPDLQVRFPRAEGGVDIVDFDWPEFGLFGEFDGFGKYVREEFTHGLDIAEIVYEEKRREDRIRRRHRPFAARWGWDDALRPERLAHILSEAGLPRSVPREGRFRQGSTR